MLIGSTLYQNQKVVMTIALLDACNLRDVEKNFIRIVADELGSRTGSDVLAFLLHGTRFHESMPGNNKKKEVQELAERVLGHKLDGF